MVREFSCNAIIAVTPSIIIGIQVSLDRSPELAWAVPVPARCGTIPANSIRVCVAAVIPGAIIQAIALIRIAAVVISPSVAILSAGHGAAPCIIAVLLIRAPCFNLLIVTPLMVAPAAAKLQSVIETIGPHGGVEVGSAVGFVGLLFRLHPPKSIDRGMRDRDFAA